MCTFEDFDEMREQYYEHMGSFSSLIDYLVCQLFKFLFGGQGKKVYEWVHASKVASEIFFVQGAIEGMATCDPRTVERCVLQASFLRHNKKS